MLRPDRVSLQLGGVVSAYLDKLEFSGAGSALSN